MLNHEVVRKTVPCAFYMGEDADWTKCRWCDQRYHVTWEGNSRTLCGHFCLPEDDWSRSKDQHFEDVAAIDRCLVCEKRFITEREKAHGKR